MSSAMRASYTIKNNQIRIRSSDTNLRRLFNTTAAVKDIRGKTLRMEEGTISFQWPFCTTVLVLQPAWLSAPRQLKPSLVSHTSPTTVNVPSGKRTYFWSSPASCDGWLCAARKVRGHRRAHGISLGDIYCLLEWKNSGSGRTDNSPHSAQFLSPQSSLKRNIFRKKSHFLSLLAKL